MAQPARIDELRIDRSVKRAASPLRWVVGLLLVIVFFAAAIAIWRWSARAGAIAVRTLTVKEATVAGGGAAVLNASGYVTARRRATVSAKVTGKVIEVNVEEGLRVRKGQVLARLDDTTARAYLNLAEAQLASAERNVTERDVRLREARLNLDRTERLVKEGVMGQAALDAARAEVDSLEARVAVGRQEVAVAERQVAVRQTDLADTIIRAPFDGVAISKDAQPGEMVSPISAGGGFTRTGISTIVDMSSLEIEVDVGESYINRVKPAQRVTATLDAYPDWQIPAHVITTVPAADRQKATVLVRIGFDELDARILPDMGVKVAFLEDAQPRAEGARAIILVPRTAVRKESGTDVVFIVRDDRAERRAVRLAGGEGDQVQVLSGLTAGEQIVAPVLQELKHGSKIKR